MFYLQLKYQFVKKSITKNWGEAEMLAKWDSKVSGGEYLWERDKKMYSFWRAIKIDPHILKISSLPLYVRLN